MEIILPGLNVPRALRMYMHGAASAPLVGAKNINKMAEALRIGDTLSCESCVRLHRENIYDKMGIGKHMHYKTFNEIIHQWCVFILLKEPIMLCLIFCHMFTITVTTLMR